MKTHDPKALHEDRRKQLWIGVCTAITRSVMPMNSETPISYANRALSEFDKKFPAPKELDQPATH